jgi:hypothetical protein
VLADLINLRLRALDAVREFEQLESGWLQGTWSEARFLVRMASLRDDESH